MLARLGLDIDICVDGRDAVERATTNAYDFILMDVHMPEMDGIDATHRNRALQDGEKAMHIIAFTANDTEEARDACKAAGMDGFLAKPFTLDDLAQALAGIF